MTSEEQFDLFCNECNNWLDRYSLNDWEITFFHGRLDGSRAECRYNLNSMQATLCLDSDGIERVVSDDGVRKSAHHEVLELLLCELEQYARLDDVPAITKGNMVDSARHKVINRLLGHESFVRKQANNQTSKGKTNVKK